MPGSKRREYEDSVAAGTAYLNSLIQEPSLTLNRVASNFLIDLVKVLETYPKEPTEDQMRSLFEVMLEKTTLPDTNIIYKGDDYLTAYSEERKQETAGKISETNYLAREVSGYNIWFSKSGAELDLNFCKSSGWRSA